MEETLTVTRLGISAALQRTLESTNPIESMIACVRRSSRNVKRWQSGDMALRTAGVLEAEQQFRRIMGYRKSRQARRRRRARARRQGNPIIDRCRRSGRCARHRLTIHTGTVVAKLHDERDMRVHTLSTSERARLDG